MEQPIVVYHCATMPGWEPIVEEQLDLFRDSGLNEIILTHVGPSLQAVLLQAERRGLSVRVARSDGNFHHFETFGMLEVQRLAKEEKTDRPILYCHTKGASSPQDAVKRYWRQAMADRVVRQWRSRVDELRTHHASGWCWWPSGDQHFSGNFWVASPVWLRLLPDFGNYHWSRHNGSRFSCEMWIGAGPTPCIAASACQMSYAYWSDPAFDWQKWVPIPIISEDALRYMSIAEILSSYGTDKDTDHSYGALYESIFPRDKRADVKLVVEVGVQRGRSLAAWQSIFPNAKIYGIDLASPPADDRWERAELIQGDATDPTFLAKFFAKIGDQPVDLFIDDGSHRFSDQLATMLMVSQNLKIKNYVIEDIPTMSSARILANGIGGEVLDRRGVKGRFDDLLVVRLEDGLLPQLQSPVAQDIPCPWGSL
jgi:hypothetical protein